MLWYNDCRGLLEQIGLVTHEGLDLAFSARPESELGPSLIEMRIF
jgi:hypothetical protein